MGKKATIFLILAAMLLGMVAMSSGAATEQPYQVGYAKVDINPYWHAWMDWSKAQNNSRIPNAGTYPYRDFYEPYDLVPLPMAGYGTNESRLSRPKLMDDNGSGVGASKTNVTKAKTSATTIVPTTLSPDSFYPYVYANNADYQDVHLSSNRYTEDFARKMDVTYPDGIYGENDGDGVWSTCVLIKDPKTGQFLLVIGVDVISIDATLNSNIRKSIMAMPEIKALGLKESQILINANHTHGSVSLTTQYSSSSSTTYTLARNTFDDNLTFTEKQLYWYLNFYKNYLCQQLAAAAVKAAADLEPVLTMEKGAIDAGVQSGHHLNGVRHSVQTYTPTINSSITYVRGSSFNNYMRSPSSYDSHQAGNGFTKSQPVSESNDRLNILQFTFANKEPIAMVNFRAHSTANNKEAAKALHYNISADWVSPLRREMEQAGYRFSLLYGNSGNLGTGVSSDSNSLIPYNQAYYSAADGCWVLPATPYGRAIAQTALALLGDVAEKNNAILEPMHAVPMGQIMQQKTTYLVKRQVFSPLSYAAALSFYNAGSPAAGGRYTIKDGATVKNGGKSITLKAGEGGTFVIASKYHASSIVSRYGVENKPSIELNTIRLGSRVAFYTTPLEAADRYFTNTIQKTVEILAKASKYNDWWNLNQPDAWGTPFDLSLTNGASGYITNELAYDYGKDYTGTDYLVAIGCYESQNSNADRGEGEKIVAILNDMLRNMESKNAYCAHCKANKTFRPLSSDMITSGEVLPGGHYFLASNFDYKKQVQIAKNTQVCLDLNGFTYNSENYTETSRAFTVSGTLNVMDLSQSQTGRLQAIGIKKSVSSALKGGTIYIPKAGRLNLYSGTLTQNKREAYGPSEGGVVYAEGSVSIYGGRIADGAATNGGNVYVLAGGSLQIAGGVIENGRAEKSGTNTMGGNVYCGGTMTMTGGTIRGGYAHFGGNVQVQGAAASFTMQGGQIRGGRAGYKTDVADLCTGQSSTENGFATFRMEGGYVETAVYSQGQITLTGTTHGEKPVRVVVKVPGQRLTIEGTYTGNIQLVLNDDNYLNLPVGAKIGNANNADLSGATIVLADYPKLAAGVSGMDLVLQRKTLVTVNGVGYTDVADAVKAYNAAGGQMVLMEHDLALSGLTRDLHLDLGGKRAASIRTGSHTLYCKDSSPTACGTIPGGTAYRAEPGYIDLTEGAAVSFHPCRVALTEVNLRPGVTGLYYSGSILSDRTVQEKALGYGVLMTLEQADEHYWNQLLTDPASRDGLCVEGSGLQAGETINSVLLSDIFQSDLSDAENRQRGEMQVWCVAYLLLEDGRRIFSETCSYSLRAVLEQFDAGTQEIPASVTEFYKTYASVLSQWTLPRIASSAK